ncbi:MAG: hypothetical protein HYV63_05530 [Candidatus Schekmanbacteria bacterium]|nr:hypothetical protein [Candidatus Schekmanbacteria bacterium]
MSQQPPKIEVTAAGIGRLLSFLLGACVIGGLVAAVLVGRGALAVAGVAMLLAELGVLLPGDAGAGYRETLGWPLDWHQQWNYRLGLLLGAAIGLALLQYGVSVD